MKELFSLMDVVWIITIFAWLWILDSKIEVLEKSVYPEEESLMCQDEVKE
jgi:hypothetical protein